jgi:hypothetical protein
MNLQHPGIGEWYRLSSGDLLEVVAFDAAEGTVEVQYFDGTVEEFDFEDWRSQRAAGAIEEAEAPEDWSGSVDLDPEDQRTASDPLGEDDRQLRADRLDDLDLFE